MYGSGGSSSCRRGRSCELGGDIDMSPSAITASSSSARGTFLLSVICGIPGPTTAKGLAMRSPLARATQSSEPAVSRGNG